jgi:hypothetical protein
MPEWYVLPTPEGFSWTDYCKLKQLKQGARESDKERYILMTQTKQNCSMLAASNYNLCIFSKWLLIELNLHCKEELSKYDIISVIYNLHYIVSDRAGFGLYKIVDQKLLSWWWYRDPNNMACYLQVIYVQIFIDRTYM